MPKDKKLVIIGDSAFAEVAYECFTHDSEYEVVGFAVESEFLRRDTLFGLPVVPFESIEQHFDPAGTSFYAAMVYTQLNRLRTRMCNAAKSKGYQAASYVSSRAFVWHNVKLGEHCFIFEDNTLQPFAAIGDNVVLWSGNHIGHHSRIGNHCFIASHVVISGFCEVGDSSFLGVNVSLANNLKVGRDNWVGPGVTLVQDTEDNQLFKAPEVEAARVPAKRFLKVKD
jgi:sugar O-acyltransferase (sialic acid O-acetyltransferase NeuD family)